jgi:2-phosphosulfolactate phosphatase
MYFSQSEYDIRFEWGLKGVQELAPISDVIIIIDVISFSTCVDVAVSRGAQVYPFPWKDNRLFDFAREVGAIPAVASRRDPTGYSLAPSSLTRLHPGAAIVLPSPNGATLSLAAGPTLTFTACLRNAAAVSQAAAKQGQSISVIAAGERWPDQTLRPALEDLLGAGAVLSALPGARSPESEAAIAVFEHFQRRLEQTLAQCGSGKEAAERGTPEDISMAAALNVSASAPQLIEGAYRL